MQLKTLNNLDSLLHFPLLPDPVPGPSTCKIKSRTFLCQPLCLILLVPLSIGCFAKWYQYDSEQPKTENIIPSTCFVGSLTWPVKREVLEAQKTEPDPGGGRMFVPSSAIGKVLDWLHKSLLSSRGQPHAHFSCKMFLVANLNL